MKLVRNILMFLAVTMFVACQGGSSTQCEVEGDTMTVESELLTIVDCGGYKLVDVENPWNSGSLLKRYALVHRDSVLPDNLPTDAEVVRVPINSALVYSSVHAGAFYELGGINAVTGIVDAEYYKIAEIGCLL